MRRHRVEALVHRALQLRLRLGEQFAHRLHPRAELDDALVGELRGGHSLGVALRRHGIDRRAARPCQPKSNARDGQARQQAEREDEGCIHPGFLRDSAGLQGRNK